MGTKAIIKKGDIYWVDFGQGIGAEIGGYKPAVIIQNDIGNKYSPITYVAPITSHLHKANLIGKILIPKDIGHLSVDSTIDFNQIRAIDRSRLREYIGRVPDEIIDKFPDMMSFIVDAKKVVIKNNYDNSFDIETKTYEIIKQFYADYKKDNSFSSRFKEYVFSEAIKFIVVGFLSFLFGFFFKQK